MLNRTVKQFLFALAILLPGVESGVAQADSAASASCCSASVFSTIRQDGITALRTMGHVLEAPTGWGTTDFLVAGGIVVGTAVSYSLDNRVYELMERNHSSFNDDATDIAVEYGSGYFVIGVPATVYLSGLLLKDKWIRETAVVVGSTVLLTGAITTIGKIIIGRARPYTGLGKHMLKPFEAKEDFMSFPSGHTTAAFALSASLAARIRNPWASVGLYGLATAAATSRMYTRDHWLSDVVYSAAYATAVAHSIVTCFEDERSRDGESHSLQVIPAGNGVTIVWLF